MAALRLPADDRPFARRLARYCARNPVALELALERLTYDAGAKQVTYRSDKAEGPTAGPETADPLEFLARVLTHIPDKGQVRFDLSRFRGEARFSLEARLDSASRQHCASRHTT